MKIASLYLLCFVISFAFMFVFELITGIGGIGELASSVLQQLATSVPMAFGSVMTAVMYYELRNVKEGVSIDSLVNVFD